MHNLLFPVNPTHPYGKNEVKKKKTLPNTKILYQMGAISKMNIEGLTAT